MALEIILRAIILILGFVISVIIVAIPIAILKRWSKIKLISFYGLMTVVSYTLGFLGFRFRLLSATIGANPLSFLVSMILIFVFILSIFMILYLVFERIKVKTNWQKVLGIIVLIIFIVAIVLPLIPGILFAFGIKTENWPVQALVVKPVMFTIDEVTLSGMKGKLMLQIQNSNPFPATMNKIDIEIYSTDGTLIATGTIPRSITILPKKYKLVDCSFEIPWTGGGKLIYDKIITGLKGERLKLKMKGYIYLDLRILTIPIPFSKDVFV
jgi:LEA14-like dessication related protein